MRAATKAHLAMLAFAFLVSTSFTVGRAITFAIDPAAANAIRFAIAAGVFAGFMLATGRKFHAPGPVKTLGYLAISLLLVTFFVTMFEGLRWTTPLSAAAVFILVPLMTALAGLFFSDMRLSPTGFAGLIIAGLAGLWVVFDADLNALLALEPGRGEIIFFIGCAAYALYPIAIRLFIGDTEPVAFTFWTLLFSVILLTLYYMVSKGFTLPRPSWLVLAAIAYLAIATTAISFTLIQYATLRLTPPKVMAYTYLIPVFVLAQRLANGGAPPPVSIVIAVLVIASAMVFLAREGS